MKKVLALLVLLLLPLGAMAADDGNTPEAVIKRVVANACKEPPGPVENDISQQLVDHTNLDLQNKKDSTSLSEVLARNYNFITFEGSLTQLYLKGPAAMFTAKVQISHAVATADPSQLPMRPDSSPGFGSWGGWLYLNKTPKADGHVDATFCLVQQHGFWKLHFVYISNAPLSDNQESFIQKALVAFANKS